MNCDGCEKWMGGDGVGSIIYSGSPDSQDVSDEGKQRKLSSVTLDNLKDVPIPEALTTIFSPRFNSSVNLGEEKTGSQQGVKAEEFKVCRDCAAILTVLYNAYKQFIQVCKVEGKIGRKLNEFEQLKREKDDKKTTAKRKRVTAKKRSRLSKPCLQNPSDADFNLKDEKEKVEIKVEPNLDEPEEEIAEDLDFGELEDFDTYFDGDDAEAGPNSCNALDFDMKMGSEILTPRPKSARIKNRKSLLANCNEELFKIDNEEETKQMYGIKDMEIVCTRLELEPGIGEFLLSDDAGSNNNADPDDCYMPDSDDDESQSEDSDSEKEYTPEENVNGKTRRHTSMLKSISRSIKNVNTKKIERTRSYSSAGSFKCSDCGQCFAHKKSLTRHNKTHTQDDMAQCPTCFKLFARDDDLLKHRRTIHGENIPFKIKGKEGYAERKYYKKESPVLKYQCPVVSICQERVSTKEALKAHVQSEHGDIPNPWKCLNCPEEFPTTDELSKHKMKHWKSKNGGRCEICKKNFFGTFHLKRHQIRFHQVRSDKPILEFESEEEPEPEDEEEKTDITVVGFKKTRIRGPSKFDFKCTECGKKYRRKQDLMDHLLNHGIGEKFKCELCGKEFNHLRSLKTHELVHTGGNPFKCSEEGCKYSSIGFARKDHLDRHVESAHGEIKVIRRRKKGEKSEDQKSKSKSPKEKVEKKKKTRTKYKKKDVVKGPEPEVECPICNKKFRKSRLKPHMYIHGERKFTCDQCDKKFYTERLLKGHIECVHLNISRYICSYCGKTYKRASDFRDHEKDHTESERPFSCTICGLGFRQQKYLRAHLKTHSGSKDFICDICGKAFNRNDNLRAHVKSVHEGVQIRKKKSVHESAQIRQKKSETKFGSDLFFPL